MKTACWFVRFKSFPSAYFLLVGLLNSRFGSCMVCSSYSSIIVIVVVELGIFLLLVVSDFKEFVRRSSL